MMFVCDKFVITSDACYLQDWFSRGILKSIHQTHSLNSEQLGPTPSSSTVPSQLVPFVPQIGFTEHASQNKTCPGLS